MVRSYIGRRIDQVCGAIAGDGVTRARRQRAVRFVGVESLEGRALLSNIIASGGNSNAQSSGASQTNIIASGVISDTPGTGVYDYTIALTNSSQSGSAIGSFWYAWVPGADYLSSYPISVTAPAGWTATVTGGGAGDGYGIQFVANSSSNDIQPGSSLSFSFMSTDPPSTVEGDSQIYSGVPVGTSAVYPGAPVNDGGTPFVVSATVTLASIAVTPASSSVPNGATDPLTAIGTFTDNSTQNLTSQVSWSSSAPSVATISGASGSQGVATGVGQGTTTISATIDGLTGSTALTVGSAVLKSLAITPADPLIEVGSTEQFSVTGTFTDNTTQNLTTAVNWTSGASSVASISNTSGSQGLATGVAQGSSTISAAIDGITGSATLEVTPELESIAVTPANPNVPKGETQQFTATGTFADGSTQNLTNDMTWSSTNTTAATISNTSGAIGSAPALETGTSSISATFEGVTGSTSLTVTPAVLESIHVTPEAPSTLEGAADQFSASGLYSDGSTQNLTSLVSWASANPSVATISPAGLASGTTAGASSISATYEGLTGATTLAVDPPPVTLTNVVPIIKRHKVSELILTFSSGLDSSLAPDRGLYRLVMGASNGSFAGKNAAVIKVSNVEYFAAGAPDTVTLIPRTPFALNRPVMLTINGNSPSGLQDAEGRLIDGNQDGQPGSSAVAVLNKGAVTIEGAQR